MGVARHPIHPGGNSDATNTLEIALERPGYFEVSDKNNE